MCDIFRILDAHFGFKTAPLCVVCGEDAFSRVSTHNSEKVHIPVSLCILFPMRVCLAAVFGFSGACINKGLLYIFAD